MRGPLPSNDEMFERWEKARASSGYSQMSHWGAIYGRQLLEERDEMIAALLAARDASDLSDACKGLDTIPKHIMDKAAALFNRARELRGAALAKAVSPQERSGK